MTNSASLRGISWVLRHRVVHEDSARDTAGHTSHDNRGTDVEVLEVQTLSERARELRSSDSLVAGHGNVSDCWSGRGSSGTAGRKSMRSSELYQDTGRRMAA
eukprot:3934084-Rhodomonas_salina.2